MKKREETNKVNWLKDCDICNTGICKRFDELTAPASKGGKGLSEREAAKVMEKEAEEQIGTKVWSAEQIRRRYAYHTGKWENDKKPKKAPGTNRASKEPDVPKDEPDPSQQALFEEEKPEPPAPVEEVDPEQAKWGRALSTVINLRSLVGSVGSPNKGYIDPILTNLSEIESMLQGRPVNQGVSPQAQENESEDAKLDRVVTMMTEIRDVLFGIGVPIDNLKYGERVYAIIGVLTDLNEFLHIVEQKPHLQIKHLQKYFERVARVRGKEYQTPPHWNHLFTASLMKSA
jgi:hypothetical protein